MSEEPSTPTTRRGRACKKLKVEAEFYNDDELDDPDFNELNSDDEDNPPLSNRKKRGRARKTPKRTPKRPSGTGLNDSAVGAVLDDEKDGSTDEDEEGEEDIVEDFEDKDVYDFELNSQISYNPDEEAEKNVSQPKKRNQGRGAGAFRYFPRGSKAARGQTSIYGGLASTLKTQNDFEIYSRFLECPLVNNTLDNSIALMCKPCNQVSSLYYGSSATLQSLLSRNYNQAVIINSLSTALDWEFDNKGYKITTLLPVIHQPIFSSQHAYAIKECLDSLIMSIKYDIRIEPCYIIDQNFNCFTNDPNGKTYFRPVQSAAVNDAWHLVKHYGLFDQLILPKDILQQLFATVRPSKEEIDEYCEKEIDSIVIEPYTRIVAITDKKMRILAFACIDVCDSEEMPNSRERLDLNLFSENEDKSSNDDDSSKRDNGKSPSKGKTSTSGIKILDQVKGLVSEVVDYVSDHINEKDYSASMRYSQRRQFACDDLVIMDAVLSAFNGKSNALFLSLHTSTASAQLEDITSSEPIYNLALGCEEEFTLSHYTITPNQPIPMENRYHLDPSIIEKESSVALIPDIIYENMRILITSELVSTSSSIVNSAIMTREQSMQKFVILDSRNQHPVGIAVEIPMKISVQINEKAKNQIFFSNCQAHAFMEAYAESDKNLQDVKKSFEPTYSDCRAIVINGLLYIMITRNNYEITRLIRILPVNGSGQLFPASGAKSIYCAQALSGTKDCTLQFMKVLNEETNLSTFLPMIYYNTASGDNRLANAVAGFCDRLIDGLTNLPIKLSIYEIAFRVAQRSTLQILSKQFLANNNTEPPELWNICNYCLRELKGSAGIFDHEIKHLQFFKFRCEKHCLIFDRRADYKDHIDNDHNNMNSSSHISNSHALSHLDRQEDENGGAGGSDNENGVVTHHDIDGFKKPKDPKDLKSGDYFSSLTHVFSSNLSFKCEPIQCEKCKDYFPRGDTMATHMDVCDSVSFSIRCPLPKTQTHEGNNVVIKLEDNGGEVESPPDSLICGICGSYSLTQLDLARHFSEIHFKCILCEATQRSVEELSIHYSRHIEINDFQSMNESGGGAFDISCDEIARQDYLTRLKNVIKCNLCGVFHGTHHNFYYHQWAIHSVVHPPLTGEQLENLSQYLNDLNESQNTMSSLMEKSVSNVRESRKDKVVVLSCKLCSNEVRAAGNEYSEHLAAEHQMHLDSFCLCKICAEITNSPQELSDHIAAHHTLSGEYANAGIQTVFSCIYCVFYSFHASMMAHCRSVHQDANPAIYQCTFCPERFSIRNSWKRHISTHSENYNFQCQECGRTFRLRNSLLTHIKNHHPDEPENPSTCEYCGLVYVRASLLQHHIKTMHDAHMPFECLHCHKRFDKESRLRRHQKESHSGTVKCEICNKLCDNIKTYAVHRRKHFKIRVYQCNDCNASFKSKAAMKRHIRVEHLHLGPEKYECQICGKVVTQIGMHMLTHKGSRYECSYCGKGFTKSAYYNEHIRIHKGELPFECHICHRRFNKKSNLNVHLKFHEKHRDPDGNYLELKHRNRISVMFGDANLTPEQRQARMNATRLVIPPSEHVCCGPEEPGAFNVGGKAWACSDACEKETKIVYVKSTLNLRMDLSEDDKNVENRAMDQFDKMLNQGPIQP